MKAIYRFNAISIKTPITFFLHTLQIIYMEPKKPQKKQQQKTPRIAKADQRIKRKAGGKTLQAIL